MLLGSGFFLYQGFSLLFHPQGQESQSIQKDDNTTFFKAHP